MWLVGIGFTLLGLMIGYVMGGKEGVDSCTKDIEENVKFRHMLEIIIKTKNNKKLKENERKRMIYKQIDFFKSIYE